MKKKIFAFCLALIMLSAVLISGCEQKEKPLTSSVLTNAESSVIASKEESSEPSSLMASTSSKNETSSKVETSSASEISSKKNTSKRDRNSSVQTETSTSKISSQDIEKTEASNETPIEVVSIKPIAIEEGETAFGLKLASNDQTMNDTITVLYEQDELKDIYNYFIKAKNHTKISDLNKRYPIQHIRKIETGYRVAYLGKDNMGVFCYFDENGITSNSCVYYNIFINKLCFLSEEIKSMKDIEAISPGIFGSTTYSSDWSYPYHLSWHYTMDGYYLYITYQEQKEEKESLNEYDADLPTTYEEYISSLKITKIEYELI